MIREKRKLPDGSTWQFSLRTLLLWSVVCSIVPSAAVGAFGPVAQEYALFFALGCGLFLGLAVIFVVPMFVMLLALYVLVSLGEYLAFGFAYRSASVIASGKEPKAASSMHEA